MEERLIKSTKIVETLLADLGVSKKANTDHHVRAIKFIADSMVNYSFGEIEKAFKMFIEGRFNEKPFQQLNSLIIGRVMSQYQNHKAETLRVYKQKETMRKQQSNIPTEAEKERIMLDGISRIEKEIKETGHVEGSVAHIYDFLEKSGRVKFDEKEKVACWKIAKRMLIADEKNSAIGNYFLTKKLKQTLSKIESGSNGRQIILAKTLLVENYFKKQLKI